MPDFTISVAGIPVGISCLFDSTKAFCEKYISSATPVFSIQVSKEDIERDRELCRKQDERDGIIPYERNEKFLEPLSVHRLVSNEIINYDTALIHGSVIAYHGRSYMFIAPSGTGKTTHTRLWLDLLSDAYVLNGDKPFIRFTDEGIFACGSP